MANIARAGWQALRRGVYHLDEMSRDRRHNVRTVDKRIDLQTNDMQATRTAYDPFPYRAFGILDREFPVSLDDVIFELGCGKGRVVCHYAAKSVKRVSASSTILTLPRC